MNESKISTRYAKALFSFAKEKNLFEKVNADITLLIAANNEIDEFRQFINSPTAKASNKKSFIEKLFSGKMSSEFIAFLKLVIANKRELFLMDIIRNYQQLYKQQAGIKSVTLTSAKELTNTTTDKIIKFVEREFEAKVDLESKINPAIIGGFILRIEDQQIDASIANKLNKIKTQLHAANL